jgi:hypothetical protein
LPDAPECFSLAYRAFVAYKSGMLELLAAMLALFTCSLVPASTNDDPKRVHAEKPEDAAGANRGVLNGVTDKKVLNQLGQPNRIARQILLGRHIEQWTYAEPIALRIEFRAVRGQEIQVVSVHSLRSKKP